MDTARISRTRLVFYCMLLAHVIITHQIFAEDTVAENQHYSQTLVLTIPGFMVPGKTISQEKHFGNLAQLIEEMNVPYRCVVYNSKEYPLGEQSGLVTEKYSIGTLRVIPDILFFIEQERIRRNEKNLPYLQDVVLIGYSQGALITLQFIGRHLKYKKQYDEYMLEFGNEFKAMSNDPVYKELVFATDIYQTILNIKYQRPRDFERDHGLKIIDERVLLELERRFEIFKNYILDPASVYPNVTNFEPPETDKYPKRYDLLRIFFAKKINDAEFRSQFVTFISEHALFYQVKDLEFRSICLSGSIFGSPQANIGYDLLTNYKFMRGVVKGYEQIKDTRLGSVHHIQAIERLVSFEDSTDYPLNSQNSLFLVGVNGEKGDDLVPQPCAHLSGHQYASIDVAELRGSAQPVRIMKKSLPDLPVVPLDVRHFPVKTFFGLGPTIPGSAYIDTENHPSFPYIKAFIQQDFDIISQMEESDKVVLRQFMVEIQIGRLDKIKERLKAMNVKNDTSGMARLIREAGLKVQLINRPPDITIQSEYFNKDTLTYVFIGAIEEDMVIFFKEDLDTKVEHPLNFLITAKGYPEIQVTLPIQAGEITFLRIYDSKKDHNTID
ncbi:MAG: hypothetical protein AB1454_09075 [Candidatus Auribacterota bacterium]